MVDGSTYLAFILACVAVVIVPGPTVTLIIANALRHGAAAGLANVAGTQAGLALMALVLAGGLQVVIEVMGEVFVIVKLLGAAYLVYLGARMLLSRKTASVSPDAPPGRGTFFWQGLMVIWSNPKALLFFGAFIPQFIRPEGAVAGQALVLGATFMAVATVLDGAYAVLAGRAGRWLTGSRVRLLEIFSGCMLIGGGLWLALTRRTT